MVDTHEPQPEEPAVPSAPGEKDGDTSERMSNFLTRFSLERRVTVLVLFFTTLVVGLIAVMRIPLELIPRGFEGDSIRVDVPWRDAPAREVLDKLTVPLEDELSTVKGLNQIRSRSNDNGAAVFLTFKQGVDMDVAYREVRDRVERARAQFPDDVERVFLSKQDTSGVPVAVIGVAVDPSISDAYNLIQKNVVFPFKRLEGIATANMDGLEEKEILIEADRGLLEAHGLNIYQLSQQLSGDNFSQASGHVREGSKKLLLRTVARYADIEELSQRPIADNLVLSDVAQIKYEQPERDYSIRVNSKPAFALVLLKEGEANTVDVSKRIASTFEEMQKDPRLSGLEMALLFNQGDLIEESLSSLVSSGRIGILLAMVVLFFFLRRFRMTSIIALSIPLSLVMALIVMFFVGETLNILTLLGLVICIGLLVDNSVVVAENVHRWYHDGASKKDACIRGAGEIALAITMATLTTVIVFLPVSLVEGKAQFFLLRLSIPISVSLLASLVVALVFIPLCTYLTLSEKDLSYGSATFKTLHLKLNAVLRGLYDRTLEPLNHGYNQVLAYFLRRRVDLLLLLVIVLGATGHVAKEVKVVAGDPEESNRFEIEISLPQGTSFVEAQAFFKRVEKVLENNEEKLNLTFYMVFHRSRYGRAQGSFDGDKMPDANVKEIVKDLAAQMPKKPGVEYYFGENENSEEIKEDIYNVVLYSDDIDQLDQTADDLERALTKVEGVIGAKRSAELPPNEMALQVDRDRANQVGVEPDVIAAVVGFALRGSALPRFRDESREIPVRVRFKESDRETLDHLNTFSVPTDTQGFLPLSALTEARMLQTPTSIFRRNKQISRVISLELDSEDVDKTRTRLRKILGDVDLPEGLSFSIPTTSSSDEEDLRNMAMAALFSVVFIYLLMGLLFESFILPLSIICTIPMASIGVYWIHFLTGKSLDMLGIIGMILLIGVVVNNGIVLIDYVIRLRGRGFDRSKALLTAADRRFRPIAMTALTTIIGMIPLTFAKQSSMGLDYMSFGMTLIGGMTTATVLTLLVVPWAYTIFDDFRERFTAVFAEAWLGRRRQPNEPVGEGSEAAL
ncbi:efflux RND transporter permease subunit [Acanthopleuribacter pedis]|uniref:Efflux RND transporter permease subunit n=1 Tax=Acanthopleuribacter pedis TaxID=442870 RepID=A0A8J7QE53_9BACT|nr:efflux RND transporter permease subunit [Acanthopleuribacter pedis]MBO1317975.1 efflux RND transporter permease subunit [Acanthopleuribacter pedis]